MKRALQATAAIAFALSFCPIAIAQTPTTNTITTQSTLAAPLPPQLPASVTSVKSIGRPHVCGREFYPAEAIRLNIGGQVTLAFKITIEGTVKDVAVTSSSGNRYLDDAAVTCVATFLYKPAMLNGQPIEVPWSANINWSMHGVMGPVYPTHTCPASLLPADGSITPNGHTISLLFHLTTDGTVRDVVVARSSGSDPLDQVAVKCISQWRYQPMMQNGRPAETLLAVSLRIPHNAADAPPISEIIRAPDETGSREACQRPAGLDQPSADTVLVLTVQRDGRTRDARVWQSSGSRPLDDFAQACSASLRFFPATESSQSVEVQIPLRIVW